MPYASKEANAAWSRVSRKKRAIAGRCIHCHRRARKGIRCLNCAEIHRIDSRAMRARLRRLGRCVVCCKRNARRGFSVCFGCAKRRGAVHPRPAKVA